MSPFAATGKKLAIKNFVPRIVSSISLSLLASNQTTPSSFGEGGGVSDSDSAKRNTTIRLSGVVSSITTVCIDYENVRVRRLLKVLFSTNLTLGDTLLRIVVIPYMDTYFCLFFLRYIGSNLPDMSIVYASSTPPFHLPA